jgi:hypothetical protein
MARKTQEAKAAKPNKSAFVRSLAFDMPSAEVIARAKARGMRLTRNDVHAIRAIARRKSESANLSSGARPGLANSSRKRSSSGINKSAFVRSLPGSMSAAEVIEKGKAKGIKLSAAQVYTIRANARRKRPDKVAGTLSASKSGSVGQRKRGRNSGSKEAEFIATALDLGLARAEALITKLRAKASSGWS